LTSIARAQLADAGSSRYVYIGAVFILLLASHALRDSAPSSRGLALVAAGVALAAVANVGAMRPGLTQIRAFDRVLQPELAALELVGSRAPADLQVDAVHAPNINAGPYFDAIRKYGSPAESLEAVGHAQLPDQQAADAVLIAALQIAAAHGGDATPSPSGVAVDDVHWGNVTTAAGCRRFDPNAPGAAVDVTVAGGGLILRPEDHGTTQVSLRQLAADYPAPTPSIVVPSGEQSILRLPREGLPNPWHARIFATDTIEICGIT
jgi:hypothetical protein